MNKIESKKCKNLWLYENVAYKDNEQLKFQLYAENKELKARYVLGTFNDKSIKDRLFKDSSLNDNSLNSQKLKVLIGIGLNPSYGSVGPYETALERTVKIFSDFAFTRRFDGWIMLNLCPLRTADWKDLKSTLKIYDDTFWNKYEEENMRMIKFIFQEFGSASILAGWGNAIDNDTTGRLLKNLREIYRCSIGNEQNHTWKNWYNPRDAQVTSSFYINEQKKEEVETIGLTLPKELLKGKNPRHLVSRWPHISGEAEMTEFPIKIYLSSKLGQEI